MLRLLKVLLEDGNRKIAKIIIMLTKRNVVSSTIHSMLDIILYISK